MPEKAFDKQIIAKIQLLKDQKESDDQINVDYGYILGLKTTNLDISVVREMKLVSVTPEALFGQSFVIAQVFQY